MALLEASGYRCTKSGASLGAFDIVGINQTGVVLVQCKSNRWPDSLEIEALRDFPVPDNALKLIHRWNDRQHLPDIKVIE